MNQMQKRRDKAQCQSARLLARLLGAITATIIVFQTSYFKPAFAQSPPFTMPPLTEVNKLRSALIETDQGQIILELYPHIAPRHVANFKYLADREFYRDKIFHIYRKNYIIQGGSPEKFDRSLSYSIPAEFSTRSHTLGTVGMARKPNYLNNERHSSSTQFHILLNDAEHMNGEYTIFGQVVKGFNVLRKLRQGTVIKSVKVFVRSTKVPASPGMKPSPPLEPPS